MLSATHRSRHLFLAFLLTSLGILLFVRPAHGAWSADPVQVHATSALCPLVSVAGDAQDGSIIAWQENTASGGLLRARRLLANGDLDPAWSAPTALSDMDMTRGALGSVSDGAAGAYVWWMEGATLYLTRVTSAGTIASGWPARGRSLGALYSAQHRPDVHADGTGGIYLAWLTGAPIMPPYFPSVRAIRLGPANTSVGGWPAGGRTLVGTSTDLMTASFGIGVSQDGGLWLAWQTTSIVDEAPGPGELRVRRLSPSGLPSTGWTIEGVAVAVFDGQRLWNSPWQPVPTSSLVDVARDATDGAFVLAARLQDDGSGYSVQALSYLRRVDGAGLTSAGWPADGILISGWGLPGAGDAGANASLRVLPDLKGGALAGFPSFGSESFAGFGFQHRGANGASLAGGASTDQLGLEYVQRDDGGLWMASYKPSGATSMWDADAHVLASASDPGGSFYESRPSAYFTRYGDVGIGSLPDGGAIFAWSELLDRHGIYAVRLNPAGAVTGVTPLTYAPAFRAWFVRGVGIRGTGGVHTSPLRVHDVTGREVARATFDVAGEWAVPGTAGLASGIYFVTGTVGGLAVRSKVVVLR